VEDAAPVAAYLDELPANELIALDSVNGWPIAARISPEQLGSTLILTSDTRFLAAIEDPRSYGIRYLLVPNPDTASQDLITQRYPRLWADEEPGFELVVSFPATAQEWRLYRIIT
jgi:hypothetical protein